MSENQALVAVEKYQIISMQQEHLAAVMKDNIGNEGFTTYDLDRIKIPSAGSTLWEVATLEGLDERKELNGIIIHWKTSRGYWSKSFEETGGQEAPECYSEDGITGIGMPGGDCYSCPFAQFGSAKNGIGQACKQSRLLFMVGENDVLPKMVAAAPASIKPMKKYFMRLTSEMIPYYAVVTQLTLEKAKSQQGITYSRVVPKMLKMLDGEQLARIKSYAESIKPYLDSIIIDQAEVDGNAAYNAAE